MSLYQLEDRIPQIDPSAWVAPSEAQASGFIDMQLQATADDAPAAFGGPPATEPIYESGEESTFISRSKPCSQGDV